LTVREYSLQARYRGGYSRPYISLAVSILELSRLRLDTHIVAFLLIFVNPFDFAQG